MNRLLSRARMKKTCVPRASGDEPSEAVLADILPVCSPRERG